MTTWRRLLLQAGSAPGRVRRAYLHQRPELSSSASSYRNALLVIPVSTFALGVWQVARWREKLKIISTLESRTVSQPLSLKDCLSRLEDVEYRPVCAVGTFDHAREVYIGPRTLIEKGETPESGGSLISSGSNTGFLVVTPFTVSPGGEQILVNRGWVPANVAQPSSPAIERPAGELAIRGLVRSTDRYDGNSQPHGRHFSFRNVEVMAKALGTEPVFLDLCSSGEISPSQPHWPIPDQTIIQLRNNHVEYFLTWFLISAITAVTWCTNRGVRLGRK